MWHSRAQLAVVIGALLSFVPSNSLIRLEQQTQMGQKPFSPDLRYASVIRLFFFTKHPLLFGVWLGESAPLDNLIPRVD